MSDRYEPYCLADPVFYDTLADPKADGMGFSVTDRALPTGWGRQDNDEWRSLRPPETALPRQGWKIHVSACLDNAESVLEVTWDYCLRHGVAFKFLRGRHAVHMRNAKHADRGRSGKLATIYPRDLVQFERVLHELGERLRGEQGPYVLSDLRWKDGPLYVRYGAFVEQYCRAESGALVPAIEDPTGRLVPDRRGAVFAPPEWVELPEALIPCLAERNRTTIAELAYRITNALRFSNSGGIYRAEDSAADDVVVLKEARPNAGLAADGSDAISRLRRERDVLRRLAGIAGVPRVRDYFVLGEHEFLVLEHIEGTELNQLRSHRYPLASRVASESDISAYTRWALEVHRQLSEVFDAIHARGVVYGDLHLSNVLVRPDGRLALLDFEVATTSGERHRPVLANPGLAAPAGITGMNADRYALACFGLALFLPITEVIRLDRSKARQLAAAVGKHFPVPRWFLDDTLRWLDTGREPDSRARPIRRRPVILGTYRDGWEQARASLAAGIVISATPDREDRLFPGDIAQFLPGGGLGIAYGAAGVLYALATTGCGRYPSFEEWLTLRAQRPEAGTALGLYDGLHGVAYVLDQLGHRQHALDLLDRCLDQAPSATGDDLFAGRSGIGLNLAHFAERTGESGLLDQALEQAQLIADRFQPVDERLPGGRHPRAGLMRGAAGSALLFLRLYEHTGEPELLEHAARALRVDLHRCLLRADGSLQVDEGGRTIPYLADGGAGIGLVLGEYLAHRIDEQFDDAERAIRLGSSLPFYLQSGLFNGRAGLITYLSRRYSIGSAAAEPEITAHIRRLNWHALNYQGHLAFPGEQLLRLSMDLATGSAGILLALGAAMHQEPVGLPLLEPARPRTKRVRPTNFPRLGEGR